MLGVWWLINEVSYAIGTVTNAVSRSVAGLWRISEDFGWPLLIGGVAAYSFSGRVRDALHQRRAARRAFP